MIAEVLPQWKGAIDNLTISLLYQIFIDLIIEREIEKGLPRSRFNVPQRRMFASDIAVWLWRNKTEMSISPSDIPDTIIKKYTNKLDDMEAVRRDLVSACFLERKMGESLYFPHRSFQEFLVAEAILDGLKSTEMSFRDADSLVTDEVSTFLEGLVNIDVFHLIEINLSGFQGAISWRLAKLWSSDVSYTRFLFSRLQNTNIPWYALFLTVGICQQRIHTTFTDDLVKELLNKMKHGDENMALLCCLCLIGLEKHLKNYRPIVSGLVELTKRWDGEVEECQDKKSKKILWKKVYKDKHIQIVIKKILVSKKQTLVLSGIYTELCLFLKDYCLISSWIAGSTIKTDDIALPEKIIASEQDQADFKAIHSAQSEYGAQANSFYKRDGKKVKVHDG